MPFTGLPNTYAVSVTGLAVEVKSGGSASVFDVASGQAIGSITLPATGAIAHTGVGFSSDGNTSSRRPQEPVARQTPAR
jgi:hypothetical protein